MTRLFGRLLCRLGRHRMRLTSSCQRWQTFRVQNQRLHAPSEETVYTCVWCKRVRTDYVLIEGFRPCPP